YVTREAAKVLGIKLNGATMAIQGFGNAGQFAALLGAEILGLKLVAASDSKGGIYNPNGLDPKKLVEHKLKNGTVITYPDGEQISNKELLELDVEVLFPAALENVITKDNASNIKAKIVCELANGPTTPEADRILHDNGVFVIPDFLANAGGVTVSYLEQVQNTYNFYWSEDEVHKMLDAKMTKAFHDVYNMYKEKGDIHMRLSAYLVAVKRVVDAMKTRGWV
ncbi:MAG: glutamate dehydrogenase, partial [Thermoplasmata archaeon]